MRNNTADKKKRMPRVLSVAIGKILPRALRDGYMKALHETYTSISRFVSKGETNTAVDDAAFER